jgi:dTDP-4-amino-4,6-dideoxygalactose transaminase
MKPTIPLSYSAIETSDLLAVLKDFVARPHEEIIADFEQKLCETTTSLYAVALNSGTSALHLALLALGVSAGDTVVVPTFTYVGSVNPIYYIGAKPIFIDAELDTWNMDPALLEQCLRDCASNNQLPKAVVVVHTYGMPAKMKELTDICTRYQVPIVEDAAEALGATYFDKPAGTLADIGILSFNSNKTITTFGGGAVLTRYQAMADRIRFLASHAREDKPYYEYNEIGFNYRLSPLNAAYGLAQLPHLSAKVAERRQVFEQYRLQLEPHGFTFLKEPKGHFSSQWLSTVLLKGGLNPLAVQAKLKKEGIETRPLWNPMHGQTAYIREKSYLTGVATELFERGLCLPSGSGLSEEELKRVISFVL